MLQQDKPDDFVISTGQQISVRTFVEKAASYLGFEISWEGVDENENGIITKINTKQEHNLKIGQKIISVDSKYYRPSEVSTLLGDSKKAQNKLGWKPEITLNEMIKEMVDNDLIKAKKLKLLKANGF